MTIKQNFHLLDYNKICARNCLTGMLFHRIQGSQIQTQAVTSAKVPCVTWPNTILETDAQPQSLTVMADIQ